MGQITSSIGLLSGIPIQSTVDKLIAITGRPRDQLVTRTSRLQSEQAAVTRLTSLVLGVKISATQLGKDSPFDSKSASSSDSNALVAKIDETANPATGSFVYTPVQKAQAHNLLSGAFTSLTDPIGVGSLSLRFGGFVDSTVDLSALNGGDGVSRGKIKITDRDGDSSVIDLSYAKTIDDVISAINSNSDVNITATVNGDSIQLTDGSSGGGGISVEEVAGGSAAAGLGLLSIDGSDTNATVSGDDVVQLHGNLKLSEINDGAGVGFRSEVDDLVISLADGTIFNIDLHGPRNAGGATNPVSGANAALTFNALETGDTYDGVNISFVDSPLVSKGNETVEYDETENTLVFKIDFGQTDANDIAAALAGDSEVNTLFSATAGGDGTGLVDLTDKALTTGGAPLDLQETTLSDVLDVLNAVDPLKFTAAISSDGDHLELTDLTAGGNTFSVASAVGSTVAEDLGLTGTEVGGVITSNRLLAGLQTTLLGSLSGGAGLGELGSLDLTDRAGNSVSVDLSTAETLDDVISLINSSGLEITASVNDARNGLKLVDTSGASASNLIIANNVDGLLTADKLNITFDAAETSVNSGTLNRHQVTRQTLLSSLNRGQGVDLSQFIITDSDGEEGAIDLEPASGALTTVGEVVDAINALSNISVTARINDNGDGILISNDAAGSDTLAIREVGNGTAAADLGILGEGVNTLVEGTPTQIIEGTTRATIEITSQDSLEDLIEQINALDAGYSASAFFDGESYRLSITSDETGRANELLVDTSDVNFSFQEIGKAQDALLLFGTPETAAVGVLVASSDNEFDNIATGIDLTISKATQEAVTITVSSSSNKLVSEVSKLVNSYNALRSGLSDLTFFNESNSTTGLLFGTNEALRVDTDFSQLLSGRFLGVGKFQSLGGIGISLDDTGKLSLDADALRDAFDSDRDSIQTLFTDESNGLAAQFTLVIEQLAGEDNSLLTNRASSLAGIIEENNDRIEFMNGRLEVQRERLLASFIRMEQAIGQFQSNLSILSTIQPIAPIVS